MYTQVLYCLFYLDTLYTSILSYLKWLKLPLSETDDFWNIIFHLYLDKNYISSLDTVTVYKHENTSYSRLLSHV